MTKEKKCIKCGKAFVGEDTDIDVCNVCFWGVASIITED